MGNYHLKRDSWESLSSAFSNLDVSVSRDSLYGSDDFSIISNLPATAITSPSTSFASIIEPVARQSLKPILKQSHIGVHHGSEWESGYGSDDGEYASVEDHDDEDDEDHDIVYTDLEGATVGEESEEGEDDAGNGSDLYSDSVWDSDAPEMAENHGTDGCFFDDSFISFEPMVRFEPHVQFISSPYAESEEPIGAATTVHEMMMLAQASDHAFHADLDYRPFGRTATGSSKSMDDNIVIALKEHTREDVELDRHLFVAYMNGINTMTDLHSRSHLGTVVDEIRVGRTHSPFSDGESPLGVYLDQVLCHVIGVFRNLLAEDEFAELLTLSEKKTTENPEVHGSPTVVGKQAPFLLTKVERLLHDRLASDAVDVGADELSFFANGVIYTLENWGSFSRI